LTKTTPIFSRVIIRIGNVWRSFLSSIFIYCFEDLIFIEHTGLDDDSFESGQNGAEEYSKGD
jgi:hypothetical protein